MKIDKKVLAIQSPISYLSHMAKNRSKTFNRLIAKNGDRPFFCSLSSPEVENVPYGDTNVAPSRGPDLEVWLDVPGYKGLYQASTHGRIKRIKPTPFGLPFRIMKPYKSGRGGYLKVRITKNKSQISFRLHRLVALTFIGDSGGLTVNHRDGNPRNNFLSNLEYLTDSENKKHAWAIGLTTRKRNSLGQLIGK